METKTKVLIGVCISCIFVVIILSIVSYFFRVELGIVQNSPSPASPTNPSPTNPSPIDPSSTMRRIYIDPNTLNRILNPSPINPSPANPSPTNPSPATPATPASPTVPNEDLSKPVKIIFYSQPDFKGNASSKFTFNYVSGGNFRSSYSINNSASNICKNEDGTALTYNYNSSTPQLNFVPLSVKFLNKNDNEIPAPNDLKLTLYGWNGGGSPCGGIGGGVWRQILGGDPLRYKTIGFDGWTIANANAGYISFNT